MVAGMEEEDQRPNSEADAMNILDFISANPGLSMLALFIVCLTLAGIFGKRTP